MLFFLSFPSAIIQFLLFSDGAFAKPVVDLMILECEESSPLDTYLFAYGECGPQVALSATGVYN